MSVLLDLQEVRDGYDVADVAVLLGVTRQTVLNLIRRGALPAWRIGGTWRITETDFQSYVEQCRPKVSENAGASV